MTEGQKAIAEFISRQSVAYRKHSANAIAEDMVLAVREFGVPVEAFFDDDQGKEWLRKQVAAA